MFNYIFSYIVTGVHFLRESYSDISYLTAIDVSIISSFNLLMIHFFTEDQKIYTLSCVYKRNSEKERVNFLL